MGDDLQVLDRSVGQKNSVLEGEVSALPYRFFCDLVELLPVRGMHPASNQLQRRLGTGRQSVDPVGFVRPGMTVRCRTPGEAAGEAETLRFGQERLTPAQGVLRLRALDGDAGGVARLLEQFV